MLVHETRDGGINVSGQPTCVFPVAIQVCRMHADWPLYGVADALIEEYVGWAAVARLVTAEARGAARWWGWEGGMQRVQASAVLVELRLAPPVQRFLLLLALLRAPLDRVCCDFGQLGKIARLEEGYVAVQ